MQIPNCYFDFAKQFKNGGSLKNELDQYGFELFTELSEIYQTEDEILLKSKDLTKNFAQEYADIPDENLVNEYDLGLIRDFSKILEFGFSFSHCPYCMDFNDDEHNPRVIFWDDGELRWRIIADNLDKFFNLFEVRQDSYF